MPLLAGHDISARHQQQQHAANAPYLQGIGVGAQHAFADPVDNDPDHQRNTGQNLVELQPPVPAAKPV